MWAGCTGASCLDASFDLHFTEFMVDRTILVFSTFLTSFFSVSAFRSSIWSLAGKNTNLDRAFCKVFGEKKDSLEIPLPIALGSAGCKITEKQSKLVFGQAYCMARSYRIDDGYLME